MDMLRAMELFVQIVDSGSMAAAADKRGLSTTMIGNYLRWLENRLGISLLHRTTRRQQLTEFGRIYYDQCVDILARVADANAQAVEMQATPRGRLRITAPLSFGAERLTPAMSEYLTRYPAIELDLALSDTIADLVGDEFEAAIRLGALADQGLIARPLAPYRMLICASPDYLARNGTPQHPADLTRADCLSFRSSSSAALRREAMEWRLTGPDGPVAIHVSGRIQLDSAIALRNAALSGMGVVMLPEVLLGEEIAAGRLVRLLSDHDLPSRPMHLVYLRDRRMSPKLRSFVDFVLEKFGPGSVPQESAS